MKINIVTLLLLNIMSQSQTQELIGEFFNFYHNVHGTLCVLDESTLLVKEFSYDGEGPDVFFFAGNSSRPYSEVFVERGYRGAEGFKVILPVPFNGTFFSYEDDKVPTLGKFEKQDVTLHLPEGVRVDQVKWVSVWCRRNDLNFGHVPFPQNYTFSG